VPEIPEDALHAAARALRTYHGPDDEPHLSAAMFKGEAAAVVAAVAPLLAEHIAARIADACPYPDEQPGHPCDYPEAAKIARGTYPPTREQP
jgi:hypothetical protein